MRFEKKLSKALKKTNFLYGSSDRRKKSNKKLDVIICSVALEINFLIA